jgi:radical SAM superfamily enzyme YgiQ (UPF0313 family)
VWLAEQSRKRWPDASLAYGGTFATLNFERILSEVPCVDFVVLGEGEIAFTSLADALLNDRPVRNIPGLAQRDSDGAIVSSAPTAVDLDDLPWPCRDELPSVMGAGFAAAAFANRGCPYKCTFCGTAAVSSLIGQAGYRHKSVVNVVDELERLTLDFGVEFVTLTDDLFVIKNPRSQQRAEDFANEMIRRRLKLEFMVDMRVDSITDPNLVAHLQRAGLRRVFMGIETGSHDQLLQYRKHYPDSAAVERSINGFQALGVEVIPGLITFHAEVGPAELRNTLHLLRATGYRAPRMLLNRMTAYAGTALYNEYALQGYLSSDWPVGTWAFVDRHADRVYAQLSEHLARHGDGDFDAAAEFLESELDAWERALVADPVQAARR